MLPHAAARSAVVLEGGDWDMRDSDMITETRCDFKRQLCLAQRASKLAISRLLSWFETSLEMHEDRIGHIILEQRLWGKGL